MEIHNEHSLMKRALNIDEQIERLKSNGMIFDNEEKAKEILLDIGYYRFGFYSFPFEEQYPRLENRNHRLKQGTSFRSVYDLYEFDTRLRRILLNALDRIEVNIRTQITYIASNHYIDCPTWFCDNRYMSMDFVSTFDEKVYRTLRDNPIIKRHHENHKEDPYAPAWKSIEFMTLGNLTSLYRAIKDENVKLRIAKKYRCTTGVFINYLETIRVIRNKCAHGSCIYNLEIPKGIKLKPAQINVDSRHNINGIIGVIYYMLGQISINRKIELENFITNLMNVSRERTTMEIIRDCTKIDC